MSREKGTIILILLFILWFLFKVIKLNIIFASNLKRKIYFINLHSDNDKNADNEKEKDSKKTNDLKDLLKESLKCLEKLNENNKEWTKKEKLYINCLRNYFKGYLEYLDKDNKKDHFSEWDFQYLKDYLENIWLKKLGRFWRIFNVHPEIIKYYKMDLIDKNSILVINFNPYVEVEKYKEIFDYAQGNNIFVFIYAKSGAIPSGYWALIWKYSIIDVVNTPIRLVNMMLSVMKVKS